MLLINNISCLATMTEEQQNIFDAALVLDKNKISWCGSAQDIPNLKFEQIIDASNSLVLPGLIDCHTHIIFAGSRAHEFARRMNGESYAAILAQGGGILSTVKHTRESSEDQLYRIGCARAHKILRQGVTTLEVKSGYGLNYESEMRILRVINKINHEQLLDLYPTYLAAHVIPSEYKNNPEAYVNLVINWLEKISEENLARDCDVFCEAGAFSVEQAYKILKKAYEFGFGLRAHVQQLGPSGGLALLERLPIKSISHADYLSPDDLNLLARSSSIVEILPFANLFLRQTQSPPIKKLISAGVNLAIATDFNPGSAMCDDLILAARLAVTLNNFDIYSALKAITSIAAKALGYNDRGFIKPGLKADILITQCNSIDDFFYDWSKNPVRLVIKDGQLVS